jgi:hypothetical protein
MTHMSALQPDPRSDLDPSYGTRLEDGKLVLAEAWSM